MTRRAMPGTAKEIRAALPLWLACLLTVAAGALVRDFLVVGAGALAFGLGSIALGALAIGHEYMHRTLDALLAQPLDRRRVYLTKMAVLAGMLAALAAVAYVGLQRNAVFLPRTDPDVILVVLLCGLFLAPWFTMMCRSVLAAIVFAASIPPILIVAGDLTGTLIHGTANDAAIDQLKFSTLWWGMAILSAVAAVANWRLFVRLEALDGRGGEMRLPQWLRRTVSPDAAGARAAGVRRRHPVWVLVKKELRLQVMTFVCVGIFSAVWTVVTLLERYHPDFPTIPISAVAMLYFAILAMLIGSLASAEERQHGTAEWQLLLPMRASRQWTVKIAVALTLAVVLASGVPAALAWLGPGGFNRRLPGRIWPETSIVAIVLTTLSLYVSSLTTSGVRAMVLSLPAAMGTWTLVQLTGSTLPRMTAQVLGQPRAGAPPLALVNGVVLGTVVAAVVLLLCFAFRNHRSAERGALRPLKQVPWLAGTIAAGLLLLAVVESQYRG
jgi:hypothetical protein